MQNRAKSQVRGSTTDRQTIRESTSFLGVVLRQLSDPGYGFRSRERLDPLPAHLHLAVDQPVKVEQ